MSRTILVVSSTFLLAVAGCAEFDATPSNVPDAGGAKPGAGSEPDDEETARDDDPKRDAGRRPDASTDGGRRDGGTVPDGGLDAGVRGTSTLTPTTPGAPPVVPTSPGAPAGGGGPSIGDTSRTDLGASGGQPGNMSTPAPGQQTPPVVERTPEPTAPVQPPPVQPQTPIPPPPPVVVTPAVPPAQGGTARAPLAASTAPGVVVQRYDLGHNLFVFIDLETSVSATAPVAGWDLAIRGTTIMLNGGQSGDGNVAASVLRNVGFDAVTTTPSNGWASDALDGNDADREPDLLLSTGDTGAWGYNDASRTYTPRAHVYAVKTAENNYFKLSVLGYYDDDAQRTPGVVRLQWAPLPPRL